MRFQDLPGAVHTCVPHTPLPWAQAKLYGPACHWASRAKTPAAYTPKAPCAPANDREGTSADRSAVIQYQKKYAELKGHSKLSTASLPPNPRARSPLLP